MANTERNIKLESQRKTVAAPSSPKVSPEHPRSENITHARSDQSYPQYGATPQYAPGTAARTSRTAQHGKKRRKGGARLKKKPHRKLRKVLIAICCVLLVFVILYLVFVYSNIPFIKKWRTIYIETAMSTFTHKWLATSFIPANVIDRVMADAAQQQEEQSGLESTWDISDNTAPDDSGVTVPPDTEHEISSVDENDPFEDERAAFYEIYWELDRDSFEEFLEDNPELLENGYSGIVIDNLDGDYDLVTNMDETISILDAPENLMIVEVTGDGYNGKLAIVKDPAQISLAKSSSLGSYGNSLGTMASRNGAVLAINASGFVDPEGVGDGGTVVGALVIDGVEYGRPESGLKLFGFKEDNRLYIENYSSDIVSEYRWAVQFSPALIVDGEIYVSGSYGYGLQPRTAFGQSKDGEALLLIVDGRQVGHSIGCTVSDLAEIMLRHNAYQAMNIDGGSSSLMWYKDQLITKCSSPQENGRYLPDAIIVMPGSTVDSLYSRDTSADNAIN